MLVPTDKTHQAHMVNLASGGQGLLLGFRVGALVAYLLIHSKLTLQGFERFAMLSCSCMEERLSMNILVLLPIFSAHC